MASFGFKDFDKSHILTITNSSETKLITSTA